MEEVGNDPVNPKHYSGDACMRAIAAAGYAYPFCIGTAMKYLWRAGRKSNASIAEDISKARWYLDWISVDLRRRHELKMLADDVYAIQTGQVKALIDACDQFQVPTFDGPSFVEAFAYKHLQDFWKQP